MANGDKTQLSGEDLTELMKVRAQLPDDDPRGAQFDAFIKGQLKNYAPDATAQAQQNLKNVPQYTSPADQLRGQLAFAQSTPAKTDGLSGLIAGNNPNDPRTRYNEYQKQSGTLAGSVAGTMATGGLFPAVKGAGMLQKIARLAGRSGAAGAGAAAGTAAGGGNAQDVALAGAGGVIGQPIAEGTTAVLSKIMGGAAQKAAAGQALEEINRVVGKTPVNTAPMADTALQLTMQGKQTSMPMTLRKFVLRFNQAQQGGAPMTYEELKGFQENLRNLINKPVGEEGAKLQSKKTYMLATRIYGQMKDALNETTLLSPGQETSAIPGFGQEQIPHSFVGSMGSYAEGAGKQAFWDHLKDLSLKGAKLGGAGLVGRGLWEAGGDVYHTLFGK